jgi:branched-chain amino acid transport system ATP-binding protein
MMTERKAPCLEVSGLTRTYGGLIANRAISFDVMQDEILCIIGPNGAGKTTLFNLLSGFERPDKGTVRFEGKDVTGLRPDRLNRLGIARTFQIMRPFARMTAAENVIIGALPRCSGLEEARSEAERCLALVGLRHKSDSLAGGLSTGQRKRLEMARAMATRPRLLLLDEITGGVDLPSIAGLVELVLQLRNEEVTLLVIEHNIRVTMQLADRVVFLHLGQKIAEGLPTQVASDPNVRRLYLGGGGNA